MRQCPSVPQSQVSVKPTLMACSEVEWNPNSIKYIEYGKLDGVRAQVLVDTGSDWTLVSSILVDKARWIQGDSVPVKCVHGDTVQYATACGSSLSSSAHRECSYSMCTS